MLRLLSKRFGRTEEFDADPDRILIDAAIERTVDGTDRRLHAAGDYPKRLREPVECAVRHVISLMEGLPAAAEISRDAFGSDPRVRALFSSVDQLREVLGGSRSIRDFVDQGRAPRPELIHGLLVMEREERTVLGTGLEATPSAEMSCRWRSTFTIVAISRRQRMKRRVAGNSRSAPSTT